MIGVMNDVADESGTVESRVKLIRSESIGNYTWNKKGTGGTNDWSTSIMQGILNKGAYYARSSGSCPTETSTKNCDFSSIGLTSKAKKMISKVVWKIGAQSNIYNRTASSFYEAERRTVVYSGRPTEWAGEVGLMYPSDYGYATSGGSTTYRSTCLARGLEFWDTSYDKCYNNDWLYDSNNIQWTITHYQMDSMRVYNIDSTGLVEVDYASWDGSWRPVVYLSTSTKITSGTGTSSDPYILEI